MTDLPVRRRATVSHLVDDTVVLTVLEGGFVSSQLWDSGRALVKVSERRGGPVVRAWHGWRVFTIDVEEIPMTEPPTTPTLDPQVKATIVEVLCSLALAEHLGDVRDAEIELWHLLGVVRPLRSHDSAWRNTRDTLERAGIPLPTHLTEDDEEGDDD